MAAPIPLIVCGKTQEIAAKVIEGLKPEYEVIHMILSPEAGATDIPAILRGEQPPAGDSENLGSKNYSKVPLAVVAGGGYDDAAFEQMRSACAGQGKGVPWLRPDRNAEAPPVGPAYAQALGKRLRDKLQSLIDEGKTEEDGVFLF